MTAYHYYPEDFQSFPKAVKQEWTMTNGLGSYAGRSLIDAQNRTHQGYLIASLHPPIERFLVFSHVTEAFSDHTGNTISLKTAQYRKEGITSYQEGQKYLQEMTYDGTVCYHYASNLFTLEKRIALKRNENTCAVYYRIKNLLTKEQTVTLTPFFNFREHNTNSVPDDFSFTIQESDKTLLLTPSQNKDYTIVFSFSNGTLKKREISYESNIELQTEVELETEGLDAHYCPYDLELSLAAGEETEFSFLCSIVPTKNVKSSTILADTALSICQESQNYYHDLIEKAGYKDELAQKLVLASDHFLSYRKSTGFMTVLAGLPWFTDWGRDTMIAFTGVSLCTSRFDDAKEILITFARYIKDGIVPNMFPDDNAAPLYNTVDASLWYFYAVERYLHYVNSKEAYDFIQTEIYPHLKEILSAYEKGTEFNIYMDKDGLIHAGSGLDQITWMDVRVGEWVATPRHGKPVEINALWYNALKVMEMLANQFGEDASHYESLSTLAKNSFCEKFWNEEKQCLYDVVDVMEDRLSPHGIADDKIRPNQIYAVSLPYTMLPSQKEKAIVKTVKNMLYIGCGLRSLAPDDPEYHGIYCGALPKRDAAYHQGTAWGFLLGGFLTAYRKVNNHDDASRKEALTMLEPVIYHLHHTGCVGSVSEIFDGDAPHNPRGCYAQAWSIGEILRAYIEDIL